MNSLLSYQLVSTVLFVLGVYVCLTRRNAVRFLMGIELIMNAASLNFIAFSRFIEHGMNGQVVAIFIIILAAAEAAVALAIVLNIFRHLAGINIDEVAEISDYSTPPASVGGAVKGGALR